MTINDYLARLRDPEIDPDFEALLDRPDTTRATALWASIAAGEASVEDTLRWAQHVAVKIEQTVINKAERDAAPGALKAIGFYGRPDPYRAARDYMALVGSFPVASEDGQCRQAPRLTAEQWLEKLQAAGHLVGIPRKTAVNRINEWRQELGIEQMQDGWDKP
ncbi:MAG: hypothetical protein QUV35_07480 [Hydrogenophaga sp.]|uniref:hypothetical protein n=1 Tax=Hydrogenophaga sp. TaxID=1904254 RepID=UPI002619C5DD|nr:hypothetical protein [Hydrogenophaga sp.]MDM7942454.1 hypothetical protein [Hydrogenophaga sp.]